MGDSTLSALQVRVLRALAGLEPPWTLTGGGALAGLYLRLSTTFRPETPDTRPPRSLSAVRSPPLV